MPYMRYRVLLRVFDAIARTATPFPKQVVGW